MFFFSLALTFFMGLFLQPGFLHSAPAHSGRTVEIFLQGHVLNLGGKKEREIETEVETNFCEDMAQNEEKA